MVFLRAGRCPGAAILDTQHKATPKNSPGPDQLLKGMYCLQTRTPKLFRASKCRHTLGPHVLPSPRSSLRPALAWGRMWGSTETCKRKVRMKPQGSHPREAQSESQTWTFVLFFRAAPIAYGSSQARGWIGTTAASLYHSHSSTATLDPSHICDLCHSLQQCRILNPLRPGIEPTSSWRLHRILHPMNHNRNPYVPFLILSSIMFYLKRLDIVPCAVQ